MNNQETIEAMFRAVEGCRTVRYPLPKTIDELGLKRDQQEMDRLFNQTNPDYDDEIQALVHYLIGLQRLLFNRGLKEMTPESMADLIIVALPASQVTNDDLKMMVQLAGYIVHVLSDQGIMRATDANQRYLTAVEAAQPDLTADIPVTTEVNSSSSLLEKMVADGFLDCQPVNLWDDGGTPMFAQSGSSAVDFNAFIDEIAAKHSPLQLLAAYRLFVGDNYPYQQILTADQPLGDYEMDDFSFRFRFRSLWGYLNTLSAEAIFAEMKVFHQFLRFSLKHELLTSQQYARYLKVGNQEAMVAIISSLTDDLSMLTDEAGSHQLASQIFTKPNYTLNLTAARDVFAKIQYAPTGTVYHRSTPGKTTLAKPLDQHQLDLEMKRVNTYLEEMTVGITPHQFADLPLYIKFVRELHQRMVETYHRRLNRWTESSLLACLCDLFRQNSWVAAHPTILRFLQLYLFFLDDMGAVKNADTLFEGIWQAATDYLMISENAVAGN